MADDKKTSSHKTTAEEKVKIVKSGDKSLMHIKVYSPFKIYFDEEASSISASNDTGPFDILPGHHNFMTLLNASDILVRAPRGDQKIHITRGIMHVKADQVTVFLDV